MSDIKIPGIDTQINKVNQFIDDLSANSLHIFNTVPAKFLFDNIGNLDYITTLLSKNTHKIEEIKDEDSNTLCLEDDNLVDIDKTDLNSKNNDIILSSENSEDEVNTIDDKVKINVGGKKFLISEKILNAINIKHDNFLQINKNNETLYFIDRDPFYFLKILDLMKSISFDKEKIIDILDQCSEQLIYELYIYELIDKKYCGDPKIILRRNVTFTDSLVDNNKIVKIIIDNEKFESYYKTISKSKKLYNELKDTKSLTLKNIELTTFRYILNLLRYGELYFTSAQVLEYLSIYDIDYEKFSQTHNEKFISNYENFTLDFIEKQQLINMKTLNPKLFIHNASKNINLFSGDNYCYPAENLLITDNIEHYNIIYSKSQLNFNSQIAFNLTEHIYGDCINDIILCLDLPILSPLDNCEYVNDINTKIFKNIYLIKKYKNEAKAILETSGKYLSIYPKIYKNGNTIKIEHNKMKMIYDNNIIDIFRIMVPLNLFDGKNNLPIKKLLEKGINIDLLISIAPLNDIFRDKIKDILLLNTFLIVNYVNYANNILTIKDNNLITLPINIALKKTDILYLYNKSYNTILEIPSKTFNDIYTELTFKLKKFKMIKDFYFYLTETEKSLDFVDNLIELEITYIKNDKYTIFSKLDSLMLNYYIPSNKLGYTLLSGLYYYSFSSNPLKNQMLGMLNGLDFELKFRIKNMKGVLHLFINEYQFVSF